MQAQLMACIILARVQTSRHQIDCIVFSFEVRLCCQAVYFYRKLMYSKDCEMGARGCE